MSLVLSLVMGILFVFLFQYSPLGGLLIGLLIGYLNAAGRRRDRLLKSLQGEFQRLERWRASREWGDREAKETPPIIPPAEPETAKETSAAEPAEPDKAPTPPTSAVQSSPPRAVPEPTTETPAAEPVQPVDAPTSSTCPACGESTRTKAKFCRKCGEKLPGDPQEAGSSSPDVQQSPRATAEEVVGRAVRNFFLGGNTVVRVGMFVLLIGIVMLLKYAIDNDYLSEEIRLAGSAIVGMALIVFGFRQRSSRPGFSHTLQGGGLAALYLVIVFGMKAYELIPPTPGFVFLVLIAGLGGALAVLQDALALIVIGIIGGFMAPILAWSGLDNQVVVFSYYLLLNVSILGVAWFKPWRVLNLVGFLFTFGVATAWGVLQYEPERLATTEPFLIAFFLLYFAVPILLADRLPGPRRGWVDGTLVFGTPLAFLAFQHNLVSDQPWGMAFTALSAAALYLVMGRWLLTRGGKTMQSMFEGFLAIGVGFVTLAIPYALGHNALTGAAWAIEGAGLYWMGVRQQRWISRLAGVALQVLGGGGFLYSAAGRYNIYRFDYIDGLQVESGWTESPLIGGLLVTLCVLFVSRHAWRHRGDLLSYIGQNPADEARLLQWLIVWGLGIWAANVGWFVNQFCPPEYEPGLFLAIAGVTALVLELAGRKLDWLPGRIPAAATILLLPLLVLVWAAGMDHYLEQGGWFGWPVYLAATLVSLRRFVPDAPSQARFLHPVSFWGLTLFASLAIGLHAHNVANLADSWSVSFAGMAGAAALGLLLHGYRNRRWPVSGAPHLYLVTVAGGLVAALSVWFLFATALDGSARPLPFIPLANPVDVAQLGFILAVFFWLRALARSSKNPFRNSVHLRALPILLLFIWFNGLLARVVHHLLGVPFRFRELWESVPLQVAYSLSWAVIGLYLTVWANRRNHRTVWITGATLLGLVVIKLFLVDLRELSTGPKIGTFLVVGLLLLIVGYQAPVPPGNKEEEKEEE